MLKYIYTYKAFNFPTENAISMCYSLHQYEIEHKFSGILCLRDRSYKMQCFICECMLLKLTAV